MMAAVDCKHVPQAVLDPWPPDWEKSIFTSIDHKGELSFENPGILESLQGSKWRRVGKRREHEDEDKSKL